MPNPLGATIAGGTRIPEQQSSIGSRPDELVSARSPFVEGRDLQSIDQETLQQPSGLFLAAEQDAADVGVSFAKTSSESVDDGHSRQAKERPPR